MKTTEKIKDLINNSDSLQIHKNILCGLIDRATDEQEIRQADRKLIEEVAKEKKLLEVIISTDEVKIYTISPRGTSDEWDIKYPFRSIYRLTSGTWVRTATVSPDLDTAYLVYLQHKYLGMNSQFVDFAIKMLEIKIE